MNVVVLVTFVLIIIPTKKNKRGTYSIISKQLIQNRFILHFQFSKIAKKFFKSFVKISQVLFLKFVSFCRCAYSYGNSSKNSSFVGDLCPPVTSHILFFSENNIILQCYKRSQSCHCARPPSPTTTTTNLVCTTSFFKKLIQNRSFAQALPFFNFQALSKISPRVL